jgi:DNA-binding MarR family transcriptional regulator
MIQETSLEAFGKVKIGQAQQSVLTVIKMFDGRTNAELGKYLDWPINRITPRVKELREKGLVVDAGVRVCLITGSMSHAWKAKVEKNQELF